jgi:hypothetical protein
VLDIHPWPPLDFTAVHPSFAFAKDAQAATDPTEAKVPVGLATVQAPLPDSMQ